MSKEIENIQNELSGLQYSIDQIQLSKINIDLAFISNTTVTKELIEHSEKYFESREESQKAWKRKVSEAGELEDKDIESLLSHIEEVKKLEDKINSQLDNYLGLFSPNQQSDFHYMLDALQNFVEWADNYSKKIKSFEAGRVSEKQLEEFQVNSEFVSLCCNWLSSTVSTVLKYGFDDSKEETV